MSTLQAELKAIVDYANATNKQTSEPLDKFLIVDSDDNKIKLTTLDGAVEKIVKIYRLSYSVNTVLSSYDLSSILRIYNSHASSTITVTLA